MPFVFDILSGSGRGPSSLIPTGLDSTIPLAFPDHVSPDARQFLAQLLQVHTEANSDALVCYQLVGSQPLTTRGHEQLKLVVMTTSWS